jgi:acetyl esterase/lipase
VIKNKAAKKIVISSFKIFCMKTTLPLLLVSILIGYASCSKSGDKPATQLDAKTIKNVAYNTSSVYQKMDVYLPQGRSSATTKILVAIHGGGWATGDKDEMNMHIDSMLKRLPSYAVFNLNYRLSQSGIYLFPAPNNDIHEAINFILSKREEYQVSDKIALLGVSAGGHLALMEGYTNNSAGKIKAIISGFGPTDLADAWNNPAGLPNNTRFLLQNYLGASYGSNPVLYAQASPINQVTAQSPPTQLFHGTADTIVRYQQSVALRNKLQTSGVPVQYTQYNGLNHGWGAPDITDSYNKMKSFLEQYLQ